MNRLRGHSKEKGFTPEDDQGEGMSGIIIRPAVQRQWQEEARRKEWSEREFTHPEWHSDEAKRAWREREPERRGGILLPLKDSDWFALGYDAALKAHPSLPSSLPEREQA
jgi:hypothetical protein